MTAPTSTDAAKEIVVGQCDREAAANYFAAINELYRASMARSGEYDASVCVQALAHHRIAERARCTHAIRVLIRKGYDVPADKVDQCDHGKFGWEDCIACYDDEWEKLADNLDRGHHITTGQEEGA